MHRVSHLGPQMLSAVRIFKKVHSWVVALCTYNSDFNLCHGYCPLIERLSSSGRVRYGMFHCSSFWLWTLVRAFYLKGVYRGHTFSLEGAVHYNYKGTFGGCTFHECMGIHFFLGACQKSMSTCRQQV